MTPTNQQQQWLKDYLRAVLTYRETYEEVYDHVLLALEDKSKDDFFEILEGVKIVERESQKVFNIKPAKNK